MEEQPFRPDTRVDAVEPVDVSIPDGYMTLAEAARVFGGPTPLTLGRLAAQHDVEATRVRVGEDGALALAFSPQAANQLFDLVRPRSTDAVQE